MAANNGGHSIRFARISQASNLLNLQDELAGELDGDGYQRLAPTVRSALETTFREENFDVSSYIKADENVKATYRGYIKFLTTDLALQFSEKEGGVISSGSSDSSGSTNSGGSSKTSLKRKAQKVAKQMITRGKVRLVSCLYASNKATD